MEKQFRYQLKAIHARFLRSSIYNRYLLIPRSKWLAISFLVPVRLHAVSRYWKIYGGTRALVTSPYFWLAIFFSALTAPAWLEVDEKGIWAWSQLPLSIIPNILGFSMGGMAIMLSFTGLKVFIYMTEDGKEESYFIKIVAAFFHFIAVQTLAIFMGLFCRIYPNVIFSFFGYTIMCYALLIAIATASQLFNTARVANIAASIKEEE